MDADEDVCAVSGSPHWSTRSSPGAARRPAANWDAASIPDTAHPAACNCNRDGHDAALKLRLPLLLTLAMLPGCFGLGVGTFGTSAGEVTNPWASAWLDGPRILSKSSGREPLPSADLLGTWGEPDERRTLPDGTEEWTYSAGLRWAGGFVLLVILPIPLGIPVGREHVTFVVEDSLIVRARSATIEYGFRCGVFWAPSWFHGGGWSAECGGRVEDRFHNPFD